MSMVFPPRIDFPPTPVAAAKQVSVRHEFLEVTTASDISTEAEYLEELSRYNQQANQHEIRVINECLGIELL